MGVTLTAPPSWSFHPGSQRAYAAATGSPTTLDFENVSSPSAASTSTVSPGAEAALQQPQRQLVDSCFWITRLSGRAP